MATATITTDEQVRDWHEDEGCCKHPSPSVSENACCVCDVEAPCDQALDEAAVWEPVFEPDPCGDCGGDPCHCDDLFEQYKDRLIEEGRWFK